MDKILKKLLVVSLIMSALVSMSLNSHAASITDLINACSRFFQPKETLYSLDGHHFKGSTEISFGGDIFNLSEWDLIIKRDAADPSSNRFARTFDISEFSTGGLPRERLAYYENKYSLSVAKKLSNYLSFVVADAIGRGANVEKVNLHLYGKHKGVVNDKHSHGKGSLTYTVDDFTKIYGTEYSKTGSISKPQRPADIARTQAGNILVFGDVWHQTPLEVYEGDIARPFFVVGLTLK